MTFRPGAPLLLLCLALAAPAAGLGASSVEKKRAELKHLQGRIGALQKDLQKSEASKNDVRDDLREVESSISVANRKLRGLGDKRAVVEAQMNELNGQSRQLSIQIGQQQEQLSDLLYQQFVHGNSDALQLLLSGEDPNQSARDRHFLALLSHQKAELLKQMHDTLEQKKQLAGKARDKGAELASIEEQQLRQRAALQAKQKERKLLLAKIGKRIQAQKQQIGTLRANEKRLGSLIDRLIRQSRRPKQSTPDSGGTVRRHATSEPDLSHVGGEFAALRGKLHLPVRGVIRDRFGTDHGGPTWKGIFIRADEGSDVHAVADGKVVYADWLRGFGNLMIVDQGDDFLSVYGNNQSLLREEGATVKAGEAIATVGASGGNEESGLYFELRYKGRPFDPLRWISLK